MLDVLRIDEVDIELALEASDASEAEVFQRSRSQANHYVGTANEFFELRATVKNNTGRCQLHLSLPLPYADES
jgi:hypothetical protein